jgi:hypothetical protein
MLTTESGMNIEVPENAESPCRMQMSHIRNIAIALGSITPMHPP